MFDISFTEILVIAIIALVVLGPERLPQVARTLGHLLGRAQRYVNDVKNDIQHEMELEELNKLKTSVQEAARTIENTVRTEMNQFEDLTAGTKSAPAPAPAPPAEIAPETVLPPDSPASSTKPVKPVAQLKPNPDEDNVAGTEVHR
jgi:sec-independent protein translocase protein TatB